MTQFPSLDLAASLTSGDVLKAITQGVENAMPVVEFFVPWTILPVGTHLWLYGGKHGRRGQRGVDVLAMRVIPSRPTEVLTERGDVTNLGENVTLRLGTST